MITRATIENWKSHLRSELEFAEGTNALVGIMGSGKTSVLDAVTFALFGTFGALQQRRIKLENIVRAKPNKAEYAEVTVDFIAADGREYEVKRRVEDGASTAELRQEGRLVASGPSRVNESVESLLKLDFDLYSRAIYSEQNNIDSFLREPRGQRMKKIDSLLRIDKFESARKNCTTIINTLSDKAEGKERILEVSEKDVSGAEELDARVSELRKQRELVQAKLREKTEEKRAQQEKVNALEGLQERRNQLEGRIASLEERQKSLLLELERDRKKTEGQEKGDVEKEIARLEAELSQAEAETKKAMGEHSRENAQYQICRKSRDDAAAKIEKMEQQLKKKAELEGEFGTKEGMEEQILRIGEGIEKARAERSHLQARREISEKSINELAEGKCPVCESELTPEKAERLVAEHREKIKEYQRGIAETETATHKLSEERNRLENAHRLVEKIIQETSDHEKTMAELAESAADTEKWRQKMLAREEILKGLQAHQAEVKKESERNRETARSFSEAERKDAELKRTGLDLEQKKKEIADVKFDKTAYLDEKNRLSYIIDQWNEISKQLAEVSIRLVNGEEQLKKTMERKADVEKMKADIKRIRDSTDYLMQFQNALLVTQEGLRKEFIESVNETLDRTWADLYPYGDYRSARLAIAEGDYVLQLMGTDGWTDVEGIVSGGERSTAALALRIAFSLVLAPHLKWLVLDEPTHNLDTRGIETLSVLLRDKIGQYVSQVFLITHEEKLEQAVTGYLYRLERNKDTDEPTRIVRAET